MLYFFLFFTLSTSGCSSLLYHPSRQLFVNPKKLPIPPEEIVFYGDPAQKNSLVAWHFPAKEKTRAIALAFHGNGENLSSHFRSLYWLTERQVDLFIFDYPGYGASQGKPTPQNTVKAGRKALAYIQKRWPDQPILLIGQSLGGAVALRTLIEAPSQEPVCLNIIESSFDSYRHVAQGVLSKYTLTWPLQWLAHLVLSDRYAPRQYLGQVEPPSLLFHREDDPVVPYEFSQRLYRGLKEPKDLISLPGSGHIDSFVSQDKSGNQKKALHWIKRHCFAESSDK